MSLERRRDVLSIARKHQLRIVEDDICGALSPDAAPLAALAPDQVIHIASLSKCVAPGLRTAFVLLPSVSDADCLAAALRASLLMLSSLPLAVASTWIADGIAQKAAADIGKETTLRVQLAHRLLGEERFVAPAASLHGWLRLPESTTLANFVAQAQQHGVRVAPADWYVTRGDGTNVHSVPNAARVTLGAEQDRARLERALRLIASILDQPQALRASSL
jgi:DNA-binding transcriptional MocR family regulator